MNTKSNRNVRHSIELTLGTLLLGSLAGAQQASTAVSPTPVGNLADDVRPAGGALIEIPGRPHGIIKGNQQVSLEDALFTSPGGVVFDGGTIYVDVLNQPGLTLGVQVAPIDDRPTGIRPPRRKVVLAGGTPGDGGIIVVSSQPPRHQHLSPASSAMITGSFGMDGTFVVPLPGDLEDIWVEGWEVGSQLGHQSTGALHVGAAGQDDELSWDAAALADAIQGALHPEGQPTKIRFQGAASLGELSGPVEFEAVIAPSGGGFQLAFDGPLGQVTATVDANGAPNAAQVASPADLVQALTSASSLSAIRTLPDFPGDRRLAAKALSSLRARLQLR
jgi:hypothetical protein